MKTTLRALAVFVAIFGVGSVANATPINLSASLTGDIRPNSPDNINVLVSVTGDTTLEVTNWVVDLNMAATHPDARLHEFYFNLVGSTSDYTVHSFAPNNWALTGTNVSASGSGNAQFMFKLDDNTHNVTNAVSLSFSVTKNTGLFAAADLLNAPDSCSNDLGCGQLGAHIGSLVAGGGQTDSGFALGDYATGTTRGNDVPLTSAPEPGTLVLLGSGVAWMARRRMRRKPADAS